MISKFFIERPVLANVLAVLMIVIGAVALFSLPVAQYPNVVPPTISVTTRYPGASARNVVDTVALPIEQQVNGVDGMIYMQSYSASDGSYSLTVTFKIGMDINFAQVLVQNRVSSALAQLPQAVQAQGVTVQQKSTAVLMFVTLTSPNSSLRRPLPGELRDHQSQGPARPPARRRQRQCVRRRPIFDAGVARPQQAAGALAHHAGRHQRAQGPEPTGRRRSARHAALAGDAAVPVHHRHRRPPRRGRAVREHRRQDGVRRADDASSRRRPGRARRPDLQPGFHPQWQAGCRHRHLSDARGKRA